MRSAPSLWCPHAMAHPWEKPRTAAAARLGRPGQGVIQLPEWDCLVLERPLRLVRRAAQAAPTLLREATQFEDPWSRIVQRFPTPSMEVRLFQGSLRGHQRRTPVIRGIPFLPLVSASANPKGPGAAPHPKSDSGANPKLPKSGWDSGWNAALVKAGDLASAVVCVGNTTTWTADDEHRPMNCITWY